MMMEYDSTLGHKTVTSYLDPDTLYKFTKTSGFEEDFPYWDSEFQFVPYWGAFVYVVK